MEKCKDKLILVVGGAAAGFLNGLFGSGGGMVVVPVLERFAGSETKKAHATAIGVILPLSVISAVKYSAFCRVDTALLLTVCAGGILGSIIGSKLLGRFSVKTVRRIFGAVIIAAALRMVMS